MDFFIGSQGLSGIETDFLSSGKHINQPTLLRRRTGHGTLYLVRERECLGGKENFNVFYDSFGLILSS